MLNTAIINKVATNIQVILGTELIRLKRRASGALINSLTHTIEQSGEFGLSIKIQGLDYWREVNYGVAAGNIPFTAGKKTGASKSDYINGLMRWIRIKGIASDNDVIKGIAFAIATKQTSKGKGWGLGNPMDKNKLGFIEKTQQKRNIETLKLAEVYQQEIITIMKGKFPSFEITI
tara:strand:- start:397 stop:924 length:528 start_codon:yes stop_codon:yes gene_type:complete